MARKLGSLNRRTVEIAAVLNRLEKDGRIDPEKWILALDSLVHDVSQDAHVRISAVRVLASYRWGLPRAALDLKTTHELGGSVIDLLHRIHGSNEHRRNLEALERRRMPLTAVTVNALPEAPNQEAQSA